MKNSLEVYDKPWGTYEILHRGEGFQIKRIEVMPSMRLSLQQHSKRSEKWIVVSGIGKVTLGKESISVERGTVVDIPIKMIHRIHNTGTEPLVFIEVQLGDYLGEDDIVRLEDDYERV